ncbi:hypothetical protein HGRIS_005731 [Hohenbuehelia grisea]|uniref:Uncharacterized protein n=1 Tax=Hohenbuehelia grisea TaxID=104357 RepID=A0ABR3JXW8_9AGAR
MPSSRVSSFAALAVAPSGPAGKRAVLKRMFSPLKSVFARTPSGKVSPSAGSEEKPAQGGRRVVSKESIRLVDVDCEQRMAADAGDIWRPFVEDDDDAASVYSQGTFVEGTDDDDDESFYWERSWVEVDTDEDVGGDSETESESSLESPRADVEVGMFSFVSVCSEEYDEEDEVVSQMILSRAMKSEIWC